MSLEELLGCCRIQRWDRIEISVAVCKQLDLYGVKADPTVGVAGCVC